MIPSLMTRRLLLCAFLLIASRTGTRAACNIIPPAEQAYPSTLGSVTSPVTTVGQTVEIRLTGCDGSTFDPSPANDQVAITFLPAGPGQPVDPAALHCQRTIGQAGGKYLATVVKAMGTCLDSLNAGKLTGSGETLCLGGETGSGTTLPSDPATSAKIQGAADALLASLQSGRPGSAAAGLHACGTDPASLTDCLRCTHVRQAIAVTRATYGPQ